MEFIYKNLTDAGVTIKAQSEEAINRSFNRINKLLICNTDTTEIEIDIFLYDLKADAGTGHTADIICNLN